MNDSSDPIQNSVENPSVVLLQPDMGFVYLVKHSRDNQTWSRFWATHGVKNGSQITFSGCRVPVEHTLPGTHYSDIYAEILSDISINQQEEKVFAYAVRSTPWFSKSPEEAIRRCYDLASRGIDMGSQHLR